MHILMISIGGFAIYEYGSEVQVRDLLLSRCFVVFFVASVGGGAGARAEIVRGHEPTRTLFTSISTFVHREMLRMRPSNK